MANRIQTSLIATSLIAATSLGIGAASAQSVSGYVSASGVEFIEAQIPSYVPTQLNAPTLAKSFACVTATQFNTTVDLEVLDLDISMPGTDHLRVDITLGAHAAGQLDIDNPYVCLGSASCTDRLDIDAARAIIDFDIRVENGQPVIALSALDLQLSEDDIDVTLADCAIDGVVNTIVGFAKGWLLGYLEEKVEEMAVQNVGPMLQQMVGGFIHHDLKFGSSEVAVSLTDLSVAPEGLLVGVDVDVHTQIEAADCIENDPGEPGAQEGSAPNFAASMNAHMGISVNFGLIDDVLYHVWRRGLTCLTGDHLEALGIHIDYDHITALLPGFPSGTELGFKLRIDSPPRIVGLPSADAKIALAVEGIEVEMIAELPDGSERVLGMSMDLEASGTVAIEPGSNALLARLNGATMTRMELDELAAAQLGFDTAQIMTMMNNAIVPKMLEDMGDLPVTGAMFNFADYAIILRGLDTSSQAYLTAEVDLFRAPANDTTAPETTILGSPNGVVAPKDARIRVGGTDAEIPSELLRYKITVDGEERPLTPIREFTVGEIGVTKTYAVSVSAVDMNGNEDLSPAAMELLVDGIAPTVLVKGERTRLLESGGAVDLAWTASDDRTTEERLLTQVRVYRLVDPTNAVDVELVDEQNLGAGATAATVEIKSGSVYRVEISVTDEAGNTSSSSVMLDGGAGCGCQSTGGAGGALPFVLAMLLGGLVMRRRRKTVNTRR